MAFHADFPQDGDYRPQLRSRGADAEKTTAEQLELVRTLFALEAGIHQAQDFTSPGPRCGPNATNRHERVGAEPDGIAGDCQVEVFNIRSAETCVTLLAAQGTSTETVTASC